MGGQSTKYIEEHKSDENESQDSGNEILSSDLDQSEIRVNSEDPKTEPVDKMKTTKEILIPVYLRNNKTGRIETKLGVADHQNENIMVSFPGGFGDFSSPMEEVGEMKQATPLINSKNFNPHGDSSSSGSFETKNYPSYLDTDCGEDGSCVGSDFTDMESVSNDTDSGEESHSDDSCCKNNSDSEDSEDEEDLTNYKNWHDRSPRNGQIEDENYLYDEQVEDENNLFNEEIEDFLHEEPENEMYDYENLEDTSKSYNVQEQQIEGPYSNENIHPSNENREENFNDELEDEVHSHNDTIPECEADSDFDQPSPHKKLKM